MRYELLLSMVVVTFLERLPAKPRRILRDLIERIREDPLGTSEAKEYDRNGRLMHIALAGEYALIYWVDDADRHVKVMEVHAADR
jgi:mRNA-degrading endonuclease RelE of RelBE toxin-antitoxin system